MHIHEKIEAMKDEWKAKQEERHQQRLAKVAYKKHQQRRKGWPSDKSPV